MRAKRSPSGRGVLLGTALLLGLSQAQSPRVKIKATSGLVLVPVSVLDKAGRPIQGLQSRDFQLFFDHQRVKIAGFDLVQTTGRSSARRPTLPPNAFVNVPASAASRRTRAVVLIDYLNTSAAARRLLRPQLERFLNSKEAAGAEVAIFGMTDSLLLLQPFTDDPAALARAAARALVAKPGKALSGFPAPWVAGSARAGLTSPSGIASAAVTVNAGPPPPNNTDARIQYFFARAQWQQLQLSSYIRGRITLAELRQLAGALAGIPGRKAVLWLTSDVAPLNPDLTNITSLDPALAAVRLQPGDMASTYRALNAADVAIFPVDLRGLANEALVQADSGMTHEAFRESIGETAPRGEIAASGPTDLAQSEAANSALGMTNVAAATGGEVFAGYNDITSELDRAQSLWSTYYILSARAPAGIKRRHYHSIKVKITSRGARLLYRRAFVAPPLALANPLRRITLAEAAQALTDSTQIQILLQTGRPTRNRSGEVLPFTATLWPGSLARESLPSGFRYWLSVEVLTLDKHGRPISARHEELDRLLSSSVAAQVESRGYVFAENFDIPATQPSPAYGRLVVGDHLSGRIGSITISLP